MDFTETELFLLLNLHPTDRPLWLAGANLHGAKLDGADLRMADLSGAEMSKVNLTGGAA